MVKILIGLGLVVNDINRRVDELFNNANKIEQPIINIHKGMELIKEEAELLLVPIHDFEHELSVKIPNATEKAIQKFRELNQGAIQKFEEKNE